MEILELMHKLGEREAVEYKKRLVPQDGYMTERCYITGHNSATEKLVGLLAKAIEKLQDECCCTGERKWGTDEYILCDACESIDSIEQELRKMGGE